MLKPRTLIPATTATHKPQGYRLPAAWAARAHARKFKDKIASRYDEATSYAMPGRDGINAGPDQGEVYDDTAMLATPEFASRIQQGALPNFSRWASFVAGFMVPEDQREEINAALQEVDQFLYETIARSNFTVEANEAIHDLALGTGALRIDEQAGDVPFSARAIPLRALDFGIGPDGRPDPICETQKLPVDYLSVLWPDITVPPSLLNAEGDVEVEVCEVWQRDWSRPTEWAWRQQVYFCAEKHVGLEEWHEGEGGIPYVVFRWTKTAGEAWGRGPLFNCLPSMRKCNFAERALLDHTDIALGGIWTAEDDGVVNVSTVRLDPGTIIPHASGSNGLRNVAPGANFDIAAFVLETSRLSIRKALYTEQLGATTGTPMSATEATHRMTELARSIGSPFARLIVELVMPAIARIARIAKDRRLIKMPKVDGKEIKLVSTSPLAMAQNFEDIERIERYLGSMVALYGQAALNVITDIAETSHTMAKLYSVPAKGILRPKAQQQQMIQTIAQSVQGAPSAASPTGQPAPPQA